MNMRYETVVLDCNLNDDDDFYRFRLFLAVPPQPQASVLSPQALHSSPSLIVPNDPSYI